MDASYSLVTEGLDGEGSVAAEFLLVPLAWVPFPAPGSPAIDPGGSTGMPTGVFAPEEV